MAGAHTAGERAAAPVACGKRRIDPREDLLSRAEPRGLCHDVVHQAELLRLDVVQVAHRVPAAAREPWIPLGRDAVGIVVRRRDQQVVDLGEIAERRPEEADVYRHAGPQLVLDGGRGLPVVQPVPESPERVVGVSRVDGHGAEGAVVDCAALTVRREVIEIAIGNIVPVGVVPGPVRALHDGLRRVDGEGAHLGGVGPSPEARHVSSKGGLHRGLPVAKQVVGGPQPRAEIRKMRHAVDPVEAERLHEPPRRPLLRGDIRVEVVEPQPEVHGQPFHRPLVLPEQTEIHADPVLGVVRSRPLHDRIRHAVQELVIELLVDVDQPQVEAALQRHDARFERV